MVDKKLLGFVFNGSGYTSLLWRRSLGKRDVPNKQENNVKKKQKKARVGLRDGRN